MHVVHWERALDPWLHEKLELVTVLIDHAVDGVFPVRANEYRADVSKQPPDPPCLVDVILIRKSTRMRRAISCAHNGNRKTVVR